MSSSVSSERAFSQGGITISKRRSRLKGDIVEALQCIKCAMRHDLLFRECAPSSLSEADDTSDQELEGAGARGDLGCYRQVAVSLSRSVSPVRFALLRQERLT